MTQILPKGEPHVGIDIIELSATITNTTQMFYFSLIDHIKALIFRDC